jgi:carboxyl-terminal processing protease
MEQHERPVNKFYAWIPLLCGVCIGAGILIGTVISPGAPQGADLSPYDKIKAVLGFVEKNYVDTVNSDQLIEASLVDILQHLDPHSGYYTAQEVVEMNEPLQGNFSGVGVEYNIIHDTVVVVNVIRGGPAQAAGLLTGDRLVSADGINITGDSAQEAVVKRRLRGVAGSVVNVSYVRYGKPAVQVAKITRGSIPIFSVESSYMLNANTGYIRLTRFAETSYDEFMKAADTLRQQGMKKLVFDLRSNGGGLLDIAIKICDEFLSEGQMIVYTKGRADGEEKTIATRKGTLEKVELVILIDENSASASEIVAGAIQDNDRGILVGRRSFGKGLVQQEQQLSDGSAFRLTIARYYTPTGRCIQKPYGENMDDYEQDAMRRFRNGELLHADSIHFPDSLKFKTPKGKVVYGGGGIMPDIFVPLDTSGNSSYLNHLYYADVFTLWSLDYEKSSEGKAWKQKGFEAFRKSFEVTDAHVSQLYKVAEANKVAADASGQKQSEKLIRRYIKSFAARILFGDIGYYPVWNDEDPVIRAALSAHSN